MTTPGTYIYNATANDIIIEALSLVGVYAPGEALPDSETADALRTLNLMLKAWMPRHGIWLNRELFLFLQDATLSYSIGPTGDHCARNGVKTELASAAASGARARVGTSSMTPSTILSPTSRSGTRSCPPNWRATSCA